jgi:hypothetical protein
MEHWAPPLLYKMSQAEKNKNILRSVFSEFTVNSAYTDNKAINQDWDKKWKRYTDKNIVLRLNYIEYIMDFVIAVT